ncbi:ribonuclease H-like domain-containing protein, partial [Tanacetum coccineum]
FSDSDYGGSNLDRKSTTGGCQFLGQRLISWQCKKQTIVATSTTEAEYVAAANCCGQVLWVQNQLLDYGFNFMNTKIHIDNESTICIVKNPVYHSKTKHIEIRHHFIRDCYEKKLISVEKIHTDLNVADLLTKPFDGPRFNYLVVSIGILTSFSNSSMYPSVFVGNGHSIPVTHTGHSFLHTSFKPLQLNHILVTPHIIKNLILVCQFTRDNDVSVEFDAYGFSVKDYQTGRLLLRCDSTGDLYPVTQQPSSQTPVVFLSFSFTTWHRGELGVIKGDNVLRKHAKLPFYNSESSVDSVFEIIHSDIWTSPIPSESGIKYYAIFLDHFSHFVWVYPLHKKSDLFDNFVAFRAYVNKQFNVDIKALQCDHEMGYCSLSVVIVRNVYSTINVAAVTEKKFCPRGRAIERYKARLVAIRSQYCSHSSLAVSRDWTIHQLDVKNVFLHGHLSETVYMHQPPGFVDPNKPNYVCHPQRSLYGLKQASCAWFQRFASYTTRHRPQHFYNGSLLPSTVSSLYSEFTMTDLGSLNYFLGISAQRSASGLFLSQSKFAEEILERAHMQNCNPCRTPVDTESKLGSDGDPQVCLYMHDPRDPHFTDSKRILRYVFGTLDYGLQLHVSSTTQLSAYTDADWAGCPVTRRSTSGYCVFLGDNLLSWSAKRQVTLSRSNAEAEYQGVINDNPLQSGANTKYRC